MSGNDAVWVGADPGGRNNFGLAILKSDGSTQTWCVHCADGAMQLVNIHVKAAPAGVGVDAPLWWSSGRSSDRKADQWIRRTYRLSGGQVQASNSLCGAALVQGMMFVKLMRDQFPDVPVTESHPNAVLKAIELDGDAFFRRFKVMVKAGQKHERDAVIAAISAREGFCGRWERDLSDDRHASEQNPSDFWLAPVHYFWPA